jgi:low affinity Fe/Cu permease
MNEWQTILWAFTIGGGIFAGMWILLQDIKKSAHARIGRLENVIDEIVRECGKKKEDFITTKAFDRFEGNINTRLDGMTTQMNTTNSRLDALTLAIRNGSSK